MRPRARPRELVSDGGRAGGDARLPSLVGVHADSVVVTTINAETAETAEILDDTENSASSAYSAFDVVVVLLPAIYATSLG